MAEKYTQLSGKLPGVGFEEKKIPLYKHTTDFAKVDCKQKIKEREVIKDMTSCNRKRLLSIIFLCVVIFTDWFYILTLSQSAVIITHLVVVLPFLLPVCVFFTMASLIEMYLLKLRGFVACYFSILFSMLFVFLAYVFVPQTQFTQLHYLIGLMVINALVLFYIAKFQQECF